MLEFDSPDGRLSQWCSVLTYICSHLGVPPNSSFAWYQSRSTVALKHGGPTFSSVVSSQFRSSGKRYRGVSMVTHISYFWNCVRLPVSCKFCPKYPFQLSISAQWLCRSLLPLIFKVSAFVTTSSVKFVVNIYQNCQSSLKSLWKKNPMGKISM